MDKRIINFISLLVLVVGLSTLVVNPLLGRHAEYHEGPSCGDCHCSVEQNCMVNVNGDCGCMMKKAKEL